MKAGNDTYSFIVKVDSLFGKFFQRPLPLFLKHGVGERAAYGDEVIIHYKGYFLINGIQFETNYTHTEPLRFVFGQYG